MRFAGKRAVLVEATVGVFQALARSLETRDAAAVSDAIPRMHEAVAASRDATGNDPDDRRDHYHMLMAFADILERAYHATGLVDALQESVDIRWEAVNTAAGRSLAQRDAMVPYVSALTKLFELQPTAQVVLRLTRMLRMPSAEDRSKEDLANIIFWADSLRERVTSIGPVDICQEIVDLMRIVVEATPDADPTKPDSISCLVEDLQRLADCRGEGRAELVAESERHARHAVTLRTATHSSIQVGSEQSSRWRNLSITLSQRYGTTGDLTFLHEAIDAARAAVSTTPPGDRDLHSHLSILATALQRLFEATSDDAALAEAVSVHERAIAAMAGFDQENAPRLYSNYAGTLTQLALNTGRLEDHTKAVQVARTAVAMCPEEHPRRFIYLTTLGTALGELARVSRDDSLWPEATAILQEALARTPAGNPGRATVQAHLARLLQLSGTRSHNTDTLRAAVQQARDAVNDATGEVAGRDLHQDRLVDAAMELFALTGETELLAEAVAAGRAALAGRDSGSSGLTRMATLMVRLSILYGRTRDTDLLHEAIAVGTRLLSAVPPDGDLQVLIGIQVAQAKATLGGVSGDQAALDEALTTARATAAALLPSPAARSLVISGVIDVFKKVSASLGDPAPLTETLDLIGRAQALLAADASEQAWLAANRAICLAELYQLTPRPELLSALKVACAAAADIATTRGDTGDDLVSSTLAELFRVVMLMTDRDDDRGLLEAVVQVGRAVTRTTADHDVNRSRRLTSLVRALDAMAGTRAGEGIRAEAVTMARAAADADSDSVQRVARRLDLARALRSYFEAAGDLALLAEAEAVGREVLEAQPEDIASLLALSMTLTQVARFRDPDAIVEAVDLARAAIAAADPGDRGHGSLYNGLGAALTARFELTRDVDAAVEAIDAYRTAAELAITRDNRVGFNQNLANSLCMLYDIRGDSELLAEAVELGREAAATTAADHPEYSRRLSLSASNSYYLYKRTGQVSLLAEALDTMDAALAALSASSPGYPSYLTTQGAILKEVFEQTGDRDALLASFEAFDDAVRRTPIGHVSRALRLANLASTLTKVATQHFHFGSGDDDEDGLTSEEVAELAVRAVDVAAEAVAATPADHPAFADYLITLGRSTLAAAFTVSGEDTAELVVGQIRARDFFHQAATHVLALPRTRLEAYRSMLALGGMPFDDALTAVDEAVALLPLLADRTLSRSDREHHLAEHKGSLSTQFATLALSAQQPERAVELLEQTRGILVADRLQVRSIDMARLEEAHPGLASDLRAATERLDGLEHAVVGDGTAETPQASHPEQRRQEARRLAAFRQEALAEHTRILTGIRALDGFQDFLNPRFSNLAAQARQGPVVYIYAGGEAGIALILDAGSPDSPRSVPRVLPILLPDLTEDAVGDQVATLLEATDLAGDQEADTRDRAAAQADVTAVLSWLWEAAVKDVLSALGFDDPLSEEADASGNRRLWWCPVGMLAFLPLHAAGHHQDLTDDDPAVRTDPRTALDRVISSYTPTLQSLAFVRSHRPDPMLRGTVAIAVAEAEDMPLPSADTEAQAVEAALPGVRVLTEPTRDEVVAALPEHLTAHFACHGVAFADPGASRLILADHQERPLTVADLQSLRLSTGLAYLSACETSLSSRELVDEAVHLTGAFHLAGYRHVIGTLWPVGAFASQRLAADFYQRLTPDRAEPLDLDGTAHALHAALRALRSKFPNVPSAWAGYVHFGP